MLYQLWDKQNNRFLSENECWNIGIRYDGRIIEFHSATCYGDSWLDEEDVTDKFDLHIGSFEELSK